MNAYSSRVCFVYDARFTRVYTRTHTYVYTRVREGTLFRLPYRESFFQWIFPLNKCSFDVRTNYTFSWAIFGFFQIIHQFVFHPDRSLFVPFDCFIVVFFPFVGFISSNISTRFCFIDARLIKAGSLPRESLLD